MRLGFIQSPLIRAGLVLAALAQPVSASATPPRLASATRPRALRIPAAQRASSEGFSMRARRAVQQRRSLGSVLRLSGPGTGGRLVGGRFSRDVRRHRVTTVAAPLDWNSSQSLTDDHRARVAERLERSSVTVTTNRGLGSGVVATEEGWIITNNHVIHDTQEVKVVFTTGRTEHGEPITREIACRVIAAHAGLDLALLEPVEEIDVPALPIARRNPKKGHSVFAHGAPFGLEGTFTQGTVSSVRNMPMGDRSPGERGVVQITAAINPGNSGGPLVDATGTVVGINSFGIDKSKSEGVNFAVSGPMVHVFIDAVREQLGSDGPTT